MDSNPTDASEFNEQQLNELEKIEQQLGRSPQGFQEVVRRNSIGDPAIIRVASIVDQVPFPTLFWISDPVLSQLVYDYESRGVTGQLQRQIDQNADLQERMVRDNENHVCLRESYFDGQIIEQLEKLGIRESFRKKGIGGNSNFLRVRCLHAYLAAHAIQPNVVGDQLELMLEQEDPLIKLLKQLR